jgi:hypothetical protein
LVVILLVVIPQGSAFAVACPFCFVVGLRKNLRIAFSEGAQGFSPAKNAATTRGFSPGPSSYFCGPFSRAASVLKTAVLRHCLFFPARLNTYSSINLH